MKVMSGDTPVGVLELDPRRGRDDGCGWISLLYLLPLWLGLSGVWWAMVLTEALTAVLTIACVLWSNKVPTPED